MDNNLPAVIQTAITKINKCKGLVFTRTEDVLCDKLFKPEITIFSPEKNDFHNISGNFMPKSHYVDQISIAAGIDFIESDCGVSIVPGTKKYVGKARGKKRLPDGTWKTSPVCEYEYDVELRAKEDILNKPEKYKNQISKERCLMQHEKFARQKANTGARLRVIRSLVGMPISFPASDIQKAMLFCRIAVNSDKLLENPETRNAAIQHALHSAGNIFESTEEPGMKNVTPETQHSTEGLPEDPPSPPPAFAMEEQEPEDPPEVVELRKAISDLLNDNADLIEDKYKEHFAVFMEQTDDSHDIEKLEQNKAWLVSYVAFIKKKQGGAG